jgi:predicted dehydrogenase
MGRSHARHVAEGRVPNAVLTAVSDADPQRLKDFGPGVATFTDPAALLRSGKADAVVIATPHPSHADLTIAALQAGKHVLVEKPIAVHKGEARRMIRAHARRKRQVFAAMFNQRTDPAYQRMRDLVHGGELGAVQRVNWIITDWFRTDAYYTSGAWRATWRGEGGGVLMNQCPHNLDLMVWIAGMPSKVRGFCRLGRYHPIEVEDDVTAYLEYLNGATGVFITTTGEAPGTNRLEIAGTCGRLVFENNLLTITRNAEPSDVFSRTNKERFSAPKTTREDVSLPDRGPQHLGILQNFVAAIRGEADLLAPAAEGLHSLELANAILLSSLMNRTVDLPLDAAAYERRLKTLIRGSRR